MKKIKLLLFAFIAVLTFNSCEEDSLEPIGANYVTFEKTTYSTGVDVGASTTFDVKVFTANIKGADRTFDLTVDTSGAPAGSFTAPASVTIPGGTNEGTISIVLTDTNLGIGVNSLGFSFTPTADLSTGAATTLSYIQNCTEIEATLNFNFDGYASETTWVIKDSLGGTVASGGPYADGDATASETITLCAGRDFTFTINDSYGDGLTYPNLGDYILTVGGVVKVGSAGNGAFGSEETTNFDTK